MVMVGKLRTGQPHGDGVKTFGTITDARLDLVSVVSSALTEIPVYASPPTKLSAPCVIVSLRSAEQMGSFLWNQRFRLTIVGPAGDNESAILSIEEMMIVLAPVLSPAFSQPIGWSTPGTLSNAGQSFIAVNSDIEITLTPNGQSRSRTNDS